jgi:hypothetical protein
MNRIKQALLVIGSILALTVVAGSTYFVFAYPSIISLLTFVLFVPVCLMIGFGFLKIARNTKPN